MKRHEIIESYRDDEKLRNKFYDFVDTVFPGLNFKLWHDKGCWDGPYIPYSIIEKDKIIANVSITEMTVILDSKKIDAVQFGTVGTIPEYRERGLSRYLMESVLDKYKNDIDVFFLFANDSVLDFYPKFGFERHQMSIFRSDTLPNQKARTAHKLNINNREDFTLIRKLLEERMTITDSFGAINYDFIAMWHIINLYPNNLYYFEDENVIVIARENNGKLHVIDVISSEPIDIESFIPGISSCDKLKSIYYYFPPDRLHYRFDTTEPDEDSPLFTLGDFNPGIKPYRFPATAQT